MNFVGIGLPELLVILVVLVIFVGPERLPQVATELARWIRRARSYAQYIAQDFNDVIGEIEKEVGTTRDDWREIANVVGIQTGSVTQEVSRATSEAKDAVDINKAEPPATAAGSASESGPAANVVNFDAANRQPAADGAPLPEQAIPPVETSERDEQRAKEDEEPWYVPARPRRHRSAD